MRRFRQSVFFLNVAAIASRTSADTEVRRSREILFNPANWVGDRPTEIRRFLTRSPPTASGWSSVFPAVAPPRSRHRKSAARWNSKRKSSSCEWKPGIVTSSGIIPAHGNLATTGSVTLDADSVPRSRRTTDACWAAAKSREQRKA